jgi:hypothetical protein
VKHIKLFEKYQDHPILDFFNDIIDDYKIEVTEQNPRTEVHIQNIPKYKPILNDDLKNIISILKQYRPSQSRHDGWGDRKRPIVDSYLRDLPFIKRIEDTSGYSLIDFSTTGFFDYRENYGLWLIFIK